MRRRGLAAAVVLVASLGAAAPAAASPRTECDPFGARACVMPFPNDMNLTVRDASTPTGRRVRLPRKGLIRTAKGRTPDPAEWNRNDGFSPGQTIVARVPGLTSAAAARRSGLTPVNDLGRYDDRGASLVVIDAQTRRRHLVWAEVDANTDRAGQRMLLIHPAENFVEGRRYIVALRNLRTASGKRIAPSRSFAAIVRGRGPARYRARYRTLLRTLARAGVSKRGLHLAWDFTVASERSLQSRMLAIRDAAFAQLGDTSLADGRVDGRAPEFRVEQVSDPGDPRVARRVRGTFTVPCFLDQPGCPVGARLNYPSGDPDALPVQRPGNTMQATFECTIPRRALDTPARISLYGHGLLGEPTEIDADNVRAMSEEHGMVFCATPWYGMADEDIPQAVRGLQDIGDFPPIADRSQQGFLAQLLLGRLLLHPSGLASDPAFQVDGRPLLDLGELYFDGNSQGAILGGALTAIAPDFRRAVLGVPAMNFSVLLYRSGNWDVYGQVYNPSYLDAGERALGLALVQMLWDRSETNGWAAHATTDPPSGTPPHTVLLHPSVGDRQVTTWQADAMARTMGASARRPAIAADRTAEKEPLFGIPSIPAFPFGGSAMRAWPT